MALPSCKQFYNFDFDMIIFQYLGSKMPSANVYRARFGPKSYERAGSLNFIGIREPVIDGICDQIASATTRKELKTALNVLDRLLMEGHYVIPLGYDKFTRVAHKAALKHPPLRPEVPMSYVFWWHDQAKP